MDTVYVLTPEGTPALNAWRPYTFRGSEGTPALNARRPYTFRGSEGTPALNARRPYSCVCMHGSHYYNHIDSTTLMGPKLTPLVSRAFIIFIPAKSNMQKLVVTLTAVLSTQCTV